MLTREENNRLTRTGPTTPLGKAFRRYWHPACLSRELPNRDSPPLRLRLLGEDFIAFRDSTGQVGVVSNRCTHRGADLFFGRNEESGIRCVYHGWKFNRHGQCIDMPNVAPDIGERIKPKACIRALHVEEKGDIVWVNFAIDPGELPLFEFMTVPKEHRVVSKKLQQCNWAQAVEGGLDTSHFSFLHAGYQDGEKVGLHQLGSIENRRPETPGTARFRWLVEDGAPRFSVVHHQAGMLVCAARSADDDQLYWRMTQFLMPNHSLTPGNLPADTALCNTWMPIDDQKCWIFCYAWHPDRPIDDKERTRLLSGSGIFADVDENYTPVRRRENDYLIDREAQMTRSYTGIDGISEQDQAIADSQGIIADRTQELLVQTDLGIVQFRRLILDACDDTEKGIEPRGRNSPHAYAVRSGDYVGNAKQSVNDVIERRFGDKAGQFTDVS